MFSQFAYINNIVSPSMFNFRPGSLKSHACSLSWTGFCCCVESRAAETTSLIDKDGRAPLHSLARRLTERHGGTLARTVRVQREIRHAKVVIDDGVGTLVRVHGRSARARHTARVDRVVQARLGLVAVQARLGRRAKVKDGRVQFAIVMRDRSRNGPIEHLILTGLSGVLLMLLQLLLLLLQVLVHV